MRVLQLFGLGNTSTLLTVGLRRLGVDCDLLVSNRHFVTQYPAWTSKYPELDDHMYIWDKADGYDPRTTADLLKFVRQYDLVHVQPPGTIHSWLFDVPTVVWDGGSGNFILNKRWEPRKRGDRLNYEQARRGYKSAKHIFLNDINILYDVMPHIPYLHSYGYIPLPVDTDVFRPIDVSRYRKGFTAYMPTRQVWWIKGIKEILDAWRTFIKDVPDAQLLITKYGADVPMTVWYAEEIGIQNNIKWLPLVPKPEFARIINSVDVVIDQIRLGALGGVSVQAMSCEQRVIVNARQDWYREQLGEGAPVINCRDAHSVYQGLLDCASERYNGLRKEARAYIKSHFAYQRVAERVKEKYEEIL